MKTILIISLLLFLNNYTFSQRIVTKRSFEILGLPSGKEVSDSLILAIPIILIGILIIFLTSRNKKEDKKENSISNNIGCIGSILVIVGVIFMLPLLAWVEYIFASIFAVVFSIIVVVIIIAILYYILKKK